MPNLIDRILYEFCCDQVKILLDRMDTHPEMFTSNRVGLWGAGEMVWLELAMNGTYRRYERWAIERKLHRLELKHSRERILAVLMDAD